MPKLNIVLRNEAIEAQFDTVVCLSVAHALRRAARYATPGITRTDKGTGIAAT
jgi:hypothetical protein